MYSWLDLRRLRYFVAIVEHGSFSEASRVLNVAQPALTHHVREMEKGYGETFLTRSRKGVKMTPSGEVLFAGAKDVLARLGEMGGALAELKRGRSSHIRSIRVSVISSLSSAITPRLLSAAAQAFPTTSVHIFEKSAQESQELIAEGKMDFAITLDFHHWKQTEPLIREELLFVSAPSRDDAAEQSLPLSELARHRLILPSLENSVLRPDLESLARKNGLSLTTALEIDGLNPRKEAVIAGLGVTVLPIVGVAAEVAAGSLVVRSFEPKITRRIVLKIREGVDPLVTASFRDILVPVLKDVTRYP